MTQSYDYKTTNTYETRTIAEERRSLEQRGVYIYSVILEPHAATITTHLLVKLALLLALHKTANRLRGGQLCGTMR